MRSEASRVPRAGSAGKHATAADDTRWRTSEDTLALAFIAHEGHGTAGEGRVALADLPLQGGRKCFGQQQVRRADSPHKAVDIDGKFRNLPLILGGLQ